MRDKAEAILVAVWVIVLLVGIGFSNFFGGMKEGEFWICMALCFIAWLLGRLVLIFEGWIVEVEED